MKLGILLDASARLGLMMRHHALALAAQIERDRHLYEIWLPWTAKVRDEAGAAAFIDRFLNKLAASDGLLLGIWLEEEFAGGVLFRTIDWAGRRTELGYWIASKHGGKGLVTRAASAMIDYAFDELSLNHVTIQAASGNERSLAVAKRLGFVREGATRAGGLYAGVWHDHVIYGLLAEEWRARMPIGTGR